MYLKEQINKSIKEKSLRPPPPLLFPSNIESIYSVIIPHRANSTNYMHAYVPVWGWRQQHLWTPRSWSERVRPEHWWERSGVHQDSTARSPCACSPTTDWSLWNYNGVSEQHVRLEQSIRMVQHIVHALVPPPPTGHCGITTVCQNNMSGWNRASGWYST